MLVQIEVNVVKNSFTIFSHDDEDYELLRPRINKLEKYSSCASVICSERSIRFWLREICVEYKNPILEIMLRDLL